MTQMVLLADSTSAIYQVVGKATRSDGQPVFVELKTEESGTPDSSFYYLADGYLVLTALESSGSDLQNNPFQEQRIAKSQPNTGDKWDLVTGNDQSGYMVAKSVGRFTTLYGTVDDVFSFQLFTPEAKPLRTDYYGKNIGWIGIDIFQADTIVMQYRCSYKNISGTTCGQVWTN